MKASDENPPVKVSAESGPSGNSTPACRDEAGSCPPPRPARPARSNRCARDGCERELPKRKLGRPPKYCTKRCRKAAFRERRWYRGGISSPARVIPDEGQNASKKDSNSKDYDAKNCDLASQFSVPLDLVGGCSRPWPGAPRLDRKLRQRIIELEVGGVVLRAGTPRRGNSQ